ncbi:hypothetical protein DFH29DRAFT_880206 [Suillus ampliporus]|nr:hypothetical protein DFH29DRAFT_880206 [Suillus ampliporus]
MQLPAVPATGPIYTYVQTINQVLRLLPIRNEEPFHGLSGHFLFMGYVGHAHQLSPIYWPEEYFALAHPPHDILRHVGFLLIMNDNTTDFCAPNSHGGISPIWLLDQLAGVQFTPATYPHGFPPPAPPVPINIPAWQTSFTQPSSSQAVFSEAMFHQSLDFEYEPTIIELTSVFDILPTPTLPDDDISVSDIMTLVNTQSFIGTPVNPFLVPEAISRQLITTSFLRALRFNQKTYDELSSEPLTIVNGDGSETIVGWSYLRNWFLDFYIDVTSELRKITRGSTSSLAGFVVDEDAKMQKILNLIVVLNSDDQRLVQGTICDLIGTQAFKEVLWAVLFRPIAELAEGTARLADLYPDAIQTWTGYLRKGIIPSDSTNLKAPDLHPRIMAALDEMYMHPDRFAPFFRVARELPSLQERNVLVMDPKNKALKQITDGMGVRRMKTLDDLGPIDVASTSDFEVPHAQFIFPVPSSDVEMDISSQFLVPCLMLSFGPSSIPKYCQAIWIEQIDGPARADKAGTATMPRAKSEFIWLYLARLFLVWVTSQSHYCTTNKAILGIFTMSHIIYGPQIGNNRMQLEMLAANIVAATTPRPPGPIRKLMHFCADGLGSHGATVEIGDGMNCSTCCSRLLH